MVIFAMTAFIFRCSTNNEIKTESELASTLRNIQLHKVEHESAVLRCPVNIHDTVHHVRSRKETIENYKLRIPRRLTAAAEATKLAINCSSSAFKKALIPFATTFAIRRGVKGLKVVLCKLITIPDKARHVVAEPHQDTERYPSKEGRRWTFHVIWKRARSRIRYRSAAHTLVPCYE